MPLIAICKNKFKKVCTTWPSWYHVLRGVAMSTDFFADHRLNWICKSLVAVINSSKWKEDHHTGLSLRAGGQGFSPTTKRVAPGYFFWKIEEK